MASGVAPTHEALAEARQVADPHRRRQSDVRGVERCVLRSGGHEGLLLGHFGELPNVSRRMLLDLALLDLDMLSPGGERFTSCCRRRRSGRGGAPRNYQRPSGCFHRARRLRQACCSRRWWRGGRASFEPAGTEIGARVIGLQLTDMCATEPMVSRRWRLQALLARAFKV